MNCFDPTLEISCITAWTSSFLNILAILGIFFAAWRFRNELIRHSQDRNKYRKDYLMHKEVLEWSISCVKNLQELSMLTSDYGCSYNDRDVKIKNIGLELSMSIEVGRLFFWNKRIESYGTNKPEAYRGIRPSVLDQLIVGFRAAESWEKSDKNKKEVLHRAICIAEMEFVSLVQKEVGRPRTLAQHSSKEGSGIIYEETLKKAEFQKSRYLQQ